MNPEINWFWEHKFVFWVTVSLLGANGLGGGGGDEINPNSGGQTVKMDKEKSVYDSDEDKILRDNNKLITSMKFDDIKLSTYDRIFNRSFTNPIGYNYIGKRFFAHSL